MPKRSYEYNSSSDSEPESRGNEPVSNFYKTLQGYTPRGSEKRKIIEDTGKEIEKTIKEAKDVKAIPGLLEEIEKKETVKGPLNIAEKYKSAMLEQAVHPDEFMKRFRIVKKGYSEIQTFRGKNQIRQDIRGYILVWKRECALLAKLVQQMNKSPEQIEEQIETELPELKAKAQRTLDRLERIPNWQKKVARLGEGMQTRIELSRGLVKKYIGIDSSNVSGKIRVEDYIGNGPMDGPKFYAELAYRTRTLSKIIDKLITNEPPERRWQGSPEHTLKALVKEVTQLPMENFSKEGRLERHIYDKLYAENDKQEGFETKPSDAQYQAALDHITPPNRMEKFQGGGWLFIEDRKAYENRKDDQNRGRFVVNLQPDSIVDGTAKQLIEDVTKLDCVFTAKVLDSTESAVQRLDPVLVFFDTTDRKNKGLVAECLKRYKGRTRPGLPVGMEPIYEGIGFANQSVVEKDKSWGRMLSESIAEVVWALKSESRPIEFETLWPRVESDLRQKGLIEI